MENGNNGTPNKRGGILPSQLKRLYDAMVDGGYGQTYEEFTKGFLGNANYANRKRVYDIFKEGGADVGNTYAEFMQRLRTPRTQKKETAPFSVSSIQSTIDQTQDFKKRTDKQLSISKRNPLGVKKPTLGFPSSSKPANKRVEEDGYAVTWDGDKPQLSQRYADTRGNTYESAAAADWAQGDIDRQEAAERAIARLGTEEDVRERLARAYEERERISDAIDEEQNSRPWWQRMGSANATRSGMSREGIEKTARHDLQQAEARVAELEDALNTIKEAKAAAEDDKFTRNAVRASKQAFGDGLLGRFAQWGAKQAGETRGFFKGAGRGIADTLKKKSFYDAGESDARNASVTLSAVNNAGTDAYTSDERKLLDAAAYNAYVQGTLGSKIGRGYKAGGVTAESLPFMLEMVLNPASGLGHGLQRKVVRNLVRKYGKAAVKKATKKYMAKKLGARVAGDLAAAATMTATTGQMRVVGDTMSRKTGEIQPDISPDGDIVFKGTEGAEENGFAAYAKAFGAQTIENHSEMVGEYFAPLLGAAGKAAGRTLGKVKYLNKLSDKMRLSSVADFIRNVKSSAFSQNLDEILKRAKFNGTIGEYAEEVVGNIENALTVGDMTLDSAENTGVFNKDINIDTFLGVGLMSGFFSAMGVAGYRGRRRETLRDLSRMDDAMYKGASPALATRWTDLREKLLRGTDEEATSALKDFMADESVPFAVRNTAAKYGIRAQVYRGTVAAERKDAAEREQQRESAKNMPTRAVKWLSDMQDAGDAGYLTEGAEGMNDAKNRLDDAREKVAQAFGFNAEDADGFIGDAVKWVESHIDSAEEAKLSAVMEYGLAKKRFDGMVSRAKDGMEREVTARTAETDAITNKDTGTIISGTLRERNTDGTERRVHIIGGNVVLNADGTIDKDKSSQSLIVVDRATGEKMMVSPDALAKVDAPIDAGQEKARVADETRKAYAERMAGMIDGAADLSAGAAYTLTDKDGNTRQVVVTADKDGNTENADGTVNVSADGGKTIERVSRDEIEQAADKARKEATRQRDEEKKAAESQEANAAHGQPRYGKGQTFVLADGTSGEIVDIDEDGGVVVNTEEPMADGRMSARMEKADFEASLQCVTDEDGNLYWERADESAADGNGVQAEESTPDAPVAPAENGESTQEEAPAVPSGEGSEAAAPVTETEKAPQPEEDAMPMKREKDGRTVPDFSATTPERTYRYVYDESGLDREEADAFVEAKLKEAEAKAKGKGLRKPKMGTDIEKYKAEKARYEAERKQAEAELAYWESVKRQQDRVVVAEREEQRKKLDERVEAAQEEERRRIEEEERKKEEQRKLGANAVGAGIRDKWDKARKKWGKKHEVILADDTTISGRYVLVESGAATASHDALNGFAPSEGFPVNENGQNLNDRDYERDTDAQGHTRRIAGKYNGRALQEPVVVTHDGVVLSGNGRTMAGEIAARDGSDSEYTDYLRRHAEDYGFTEEDVAGMEHPRVLFVPDEPMPYTTATMAKFNKSGMKQQSKTETAVKMGKLVDDALFGRIAATIGGYETLGAFYADDSATAAVVRELAKAGVVGETEIPSLFDGGSLSQSGQELIESLLVGKLFAANPDAVRQLTEVRNLRQSVAYAIQAIVRNSELGGGYSLAEELARAVRLAYLARKNGFKAGDRVSGFARQGNLFQYDDGATVEDFSNATVMMLADALNDGRVSLLKSVLVQYNELAADAAAGVADIFSGETRTKEDIIKFINDYLFGKRGKEEKEESNGREQDESAGGKHAGKPDAESGTGGGSVEESNERDGAGRADEPIAGTEAPIASENKTDGTAEQEDEPKPIGKGVFGNIYDAFKGKAKKAFDFLMKHKSGDLLGVFHRKDLGDIDLVWGDENMGLSHILGKHVGEGKDFATAEEALEMLESIVNGGNVIRDNENRYVIELNGYRVGIRKDYDGKKKNWIVTAIDYNRTQEEKGIATNPTSASHGAYGPEVAVPSNTFADKSTDNAAPAQGTEGKSGENGVAANAPAKAETKLSEGKGYAITPATYTNKKGKTSDVHLLTFDKELTAEQERAVKEFAKERTGKGRFAPARGWKDRESGGWMFRTEEDARKAAELAADPEAVADNQPLSAKDMRDAVKTETHEEENGGKKPELEPKPEPKDAPKTEHSAEGNTTETKKEEAKTEEATPEEAEVTETEKTNTETGTGTEPNADFAVSFPNCGKPSGLTLDFSGKGNKRLSARNFVSSDPMRPQMGGVHYDGGFAVASNGRAMAVVRTDYAPELEGKTLLAKGGTETGGRPFPDWRAAAAKFASQNKTAVDAAAFMEAAKKAKAAQKGLEYGAFASVIVGGRVMEADKAAIIADALAKVSNAELYATELGLMVTGDGAIVIVMHDVLLKEDDVRSLGYPLFPVDGEAAAAERIRAAEGEDGKRKDAEERGASEEGSKTEYSTSDTATNAVEDTQKSGENKKGKSAKGKTAQADESATDEEITDVGEKIGGAKKDKFREMAEAAAKAQGESDETLSAFIAKTPLSKIFGFDLAKMRAGGVSNAAVSFIAAAKGMIPAKPRTPWKLRRWVGNVLKLYRASLEAFADGESVGERMANAEDTDFKRRYDAYMAVGGYDSGLNTGKAGLLQFPKDSGAGMYGKSGEWISHDGWWYVSNAGKYSDVYKTREEAVAALRAFAGESVSAAAGKGGRKEIRFVVYRSKDGTYYIAPKGKMNVPVQGGLATVKEAFEYIDAHNAELQERYRGIVDGTIVTLGENRERKGRDWRAGRDVGADEFMQSFGFRGVEFGNWMKQEDRRKALNECYDALMDLADVCGVSPLALSLDGKLGLAFGARGNGRASAHYEPGKEVINLTKTQGAGSLAHEWFHAVDNYFSKMGGEEGYATSGNGITPLEVAVIGDRLTEAERRQAFARYPVRMEMAAAWEYLSAAIEESEYGKRSRAYSELHNSKYWREPTEMGARAFSVWVETQLSKRDATNDYLANNPKLFEKELEESRRRFTPYPFDTDAEWMDEAFGNLFSTMQEKVDEETGHHVLYQKAEGASPVSREEQALRGALADHLRESGMEVIDDAEEGQRVLDVANGRGARLEAKQKGALATVSVSRSEKHPQTVIASATGAKVLNNLDSLAENYEKSADTKEKTFIGEVAKALGIASRSKSSQYATFETKSGKVVTIRLSNHNATVSNFDNNGEADGISIVVSPKKNEGVANDGEAHVTEFFYDAIKLRKAEGKPLAEIVRSIQQALYSGEFEDRTGLAERQEVNADDAARLQKVYHGSGADFDQFDHSHMGEGEGAQAYGWGTYVTEVEGIGRTYAESGRKKVPEFVYDGQEMDFSHLAAELSDIAGIENQQAVMHFLWEWDNNGGKRAKEWLAYETREVKDWRNHSSNPSAYDEKIAGLEALAKVKGIRKNTKVNKTNLYEVEIPDDNGSNYLDWDKEYSADEVTAVIDRLIDTAIAKEKDGQLDDAELLRGAADHLASWAYEDHDGGFFDKFSGENIYRKIAGSFDYYSDEDASKLLSEAGYTGIKYPANYRRGGRADGASNYVIFNEADANITDRVRFFRTSSGAAYGFTVGGKIYIDPRIATSETPIHEYAHLWASALRAGNAKEWRHVVSLMKGTGLWEEVKRNYPELTTDDEIADEVIAHYSGRRGAERLREEARKIAEGKGGVFEKAEAVSALERVRRALSAFWKGVADFLHIRYTSAEEVADRVMKDMLDGLDPRKFGKDNGLRLEKSAEVENIVSKAKANGTYMKAPNGERSKLSPRQWAQDEAYLDAVTRGDMEAAQRMVDEAAERAGYSSKSEYQGTSAFNGAAPYGNGYFLSKEERKEAWDNGEYDGDQTLGDYIERGIDAMNLDFVALDPRNYRMADANRKEAIENVRDTISRKSKTITMYRSVPSGVKENSFRNGDWVSPSRGYAEENARIHGWGSNYRIIEQEVPVDEVWWDGNDIAEWGYGREADYVNGTDYAYKNTRNNRKSLETVTYDDRGNIIPLSQRFNSRKADVRYRENNAQNAENQVRTEENEATEQAKTERVNELSGRLNTPVRVISTEEEIAGLPNDRQRRAKGWYDTRTGEVTIVMPNNADAADVENTFLHEVVGHDGLRVLFPEEGQLDNALDELYRVSERGIQQAIDRMAQKMQEAEVARLMEQKRKQHEARGENPNTYYYADLAEASLEASKKRGQYRRAAAEEYAADLAGRIGVEGFEKMGAEERTFWGRLKTVLQNALRRLSAGLGIKSKREWTDKEWAYVLHEAYKRKKNGGRPSAFDVADTVVMRGKTKFGEANREEESIDAVNGRFNEQLGTFTEENADNVVLSLGRPSPVLRAAGVEDKPMKLYGNKVTKKMRKHGFSLDELRDLPRAVANPIAVFDNYGKDGNRSILTELRTTKGNFLVTISLGKGKEDIDFNIVSSVFGKGEDNIVDWLNKGFATYINKEKALNYLHHSALRAVTSESPRLISAAKVVKDFVNPKETGEKVSDTDIMFRDGDGVQYQKAQARDTYERRVATGLYQAREALQDSMLSLKVAMDTIMKAEGKKTHIEDIAGYENAYLGENRLSSVNQAECKEYARTLFKPLLEEVAKLAATADERAELTDYMMAKHGLERNEVMARRNAERQANEEYGALIRKAERDLDKYPGDGMYMARLDEVRQLRDFRIEQLLAADDRDYSGLTTLTQTDGVGAAEAEARRMVEEYEKAHETGELWNRVNAVTGATLAKCRDCGLISKAQYDEISRMYKHYIPLRGFDEKTDAEVYAHIGDKRSGFASPIKTARGRKSKADDPFANMEAMMESAIMAGNRNSLVKQRFLNFVLGHPSDLVSVSDLWLIHDDAADEWKPALPGDVAGTERIEEDDTPAEVERKTREFEERMAALAKKEPQRYTRQGDSPNVYYRLVDNEDLKQHQVVVKRGGKAIVLTINGNPRAAQALNGLTNPDNATGGIAKFFEWGEAVNRQLSAFYTTRNPDFVVSNFVRDSVYSNTMVWAKENRNYAVRFNLNWARMNPAKMKTLLAKLRDGTLDESNETEKMFRQFMLNGGETGYTSVRDIEKHKKDIAKELKKLNGQMPVGKALGLLAERFDEINRAVENCARFAAFMTSRQLGRSIDRAIWDAKEVSVNFNKKGSGAKFHGAKGQTWLGNKAALASGFGRSFYVFWNAAVQGTTNFGRNVGRHPVKGLAGAAAMFALGMLAAGIGGGGDDDKDGYYNLPDYVRRSNIVFRVPGMDKSWISVPLPVEYRALYGMGELAMSVLSGKAHYSAGELAHEMAAQVSQMLPLDVLEGGGGVSAFVPSSVKPIAEVLANKSWTGLPIYKENDWNKDDPGYKKVYKNANKALVGASKWINEATGGDEYTSGWGDVVNPAVAEHLLNGYFGGVARGLGELAAMGETLVGMREYDPKDFMFVNRLVKRGDERTEFRAVNNEYFRVKEASEGLRKRLRHYEEDTAKGVFDYAEKISKLNNSPEFRVLWAYEAHAPEIDAINEQLKEPTLGEEDRKELEAQLNEAKRRLVDAVNEARGEKR